MTDEQRKDIKKKLREMLIFDRTQIGTLTATRIPGGIIYQEGTAATFVPYNETCAFDLDDKRKSND